MKRVLLLETLSQINGGQKMSLLVSDMLSSSGEYEVIWAIPEEGVLAKKLNSEGIKYYLLGDLTLPAGIKGKKAIVQYGAMSIRAISKILSIISKEKIDIIYAPGPASIPWSAICGSIKKKPVVWHLHHNFTDGPTKKLINICSKFKSVRTILAVSKNVGEQIPNIQKVRVLYNPVDFDKYSSGDASRVKTEYPFNTESRIICHVALLEIEKNQEATIRILAELKKKNEDYRAVFVGTVKPGDEQYLSALHAIASELGVEDFCSFLGYRTDIPDLLKASDIAIIPSLEGFPLAGLEACAAGVPVLACDLGGAAELIDIAQCGLKYPDGDYQRAAEIIDKCVNKNEFKTNGALFAKECKLSDYQSHLLNTFEAL